MNDVMTKGLCKHLRLRLVQLLLGVAGALIPVPWLWAQEGADQQAVRIEAAQSPNRGALDGLSLREVMQKLHVPGASVAVIKDFRVAWTRSYGLADVSSHRPVETDTLFQAASLSKPVTAMAVMRLVQEGRLRLDDDVNRSLKSWQVPKSASTRERPVTLRALLSHTSGADDGFGFPGYAPGTPLPTIVKILNGEPPSNVGPVVFARPPYQAYKYSGGGFLIVEQLLTDVVGESFEQIMQTRVLKPLQMTHSSFQQPLSDAHAARAARAHDGSGARTDVPWRVHPELAPAGLWTTSNDMARFVIEIQRAIRGPAGAVLNQASAREMTAPTGVGPFGAGTAISQRGQGWYFRHTGSNFGFRSAFVGHVRKGYGLVVMSNGGDGERLFQEIEDRVAAAYDWDTLDKPLFRD